MAADLSASAGVGASSSWRRTATTFCDLKPSPTWSIDQVRFSEEARAAARRALYSTRMLDPGHEDGWAEFLLAEARDQLAAVLPTSRRACCREDGGTGEAKCDFKGAKATYTELMKVWHEACGFAGVNTTSWEGDWNLGGATPGIADVKAVERVRRLDACLVQFLRQSVPASGFLRATYVWIPAALQLTRQYAATLVATALALLAVFGLEAVRSLYRNNLVVTGWCVSLALAGPVVIAFISSRSRRRNATKAWDRGGRVFRSVRPHVLLPPPWRSRHPSYQESQAVIVGRTVLLALLLVSWLVMGAGAAGLTALGFLDDVSLTLYAITALLLTAVALGSTADFLDLHCQPPFRRSILIGLGIYALSILIFDSPVAGVVALVTWLLLLILWADKVGFRTIRPVYGVILVGVTFILGSTYARRWAETWRPLSANEPGYWPQDFMVTQDLWPAGQALPDPPPVVVIAASGGGSRAAIYTAMTLSALESGLPEVSRNLQAIGSVSGGSLASAAYIAQRLAAESGSGALDCEGTLVEHMGGDFLRPVLAGAFITLKGRGAAIESHWQGCPVGLGATRMSDLARAWRTRISEEGDTLPPFPMPLFHSASLTRHAVVLSPLSNQMYQALEIQQEATRPETNQYSQLSPLGQPLWVFYRSGLYGLEQILPGFDPSLSKAVRASANFPFGFPLVEIRSRQSLYLSPWDADRDPDQSKLVRLTDGGALSNSGLWALYRLLANQETTLRGRGLLLIIVDASAMPRAPTPNRMTGLAAAILDKSPKGEFLHRSLLSELATTFGGCFDAIELEIRAIQALNVHTTWALDARSIERLTSAFDQEWRLEGARIESQFEALKQCDPSARSPWNGGSRVPIS